MTSPCPLLKTGGGKLEFGKSGGNLFKHQFWHLEYFTVSDADDFVT